MLGEYILAIISMFVGVLGKIIYDKYRDYNKRKKFEDNWKGKMRPLIDEFNELKNKLESINNNADKLTYNNINELIRKAIRITELLKEIQDEDIINAINKDKKIDFYFKRLQECKIEDKIKYKVLDISPLLRYELIKGDINSEIEAIIPAQSKELTKLLRDFSSKYQNIKIKDTITDNDISKAFPQLMMLVKQNKRKYCNLYKGLNFIISIQEATNNKNKYDLEIKYTHESYQRIIALYENWFDKLTQNVHEQLSHPTPNTRGGNQKILEKIDKMILPEIPHYIIDIMERNHINICAEHYESNYNIKDN
ncbi:MAG: hypothetical protein KatS3mg003_1653 [Candidatus Nitrosocaldaceae archaeon]|nr:MAG: hypothetical protein KatS3mg003_1653 [Candidatus Nitrosocaldaceae archaeon]